ncbi:DUF4845 domain-containing protein [Chitinimonas sp. BJYL2]|uniref:DUF4845 domain-containing protein n=1 Tax=Chitinimonas sp. BJYL2 TaxID=2976696 RepID=UPI0022B3E542|nr:DUF4845 domain-containing protein [Chitinimonas sp. BJYL2]
MRKQRGVSMINMLTWAIILGGALVLGLKMVPAYTEYFGVKKAIADIAKQMAGAPPAEIRAAFDKRATIDYITTVQGTDLDIIQDQSGTTISTSYEKIIPLVANVSLKFDFTTEAKHGGEGQ